MPRAKFWVLVTAQSCFSSGSPDAKSKRTTTPLLFGTIYPQGTQVFTKGR